MRRLLVAGNWKMNGSVSMTDDLLSRLLDADVSACDVAVFPSFPYLSSARKQLNGSAMLLGAQNCAEEESGAYTGEVSATMLQDIGCHLCLVGHSERRTLYGEDNDTVLNKVQRLLNAGISPVVCIGETLSDRQSGQENAVVTRQLQQLLSELSEEQWQHITLAYEPVWAIGTGETATPDQAQGMHAFIRSLLHQVSEETAQKTRILYGGSVRAANAVELFAQPDIDGGLVGGASLDAAEFLEICCS